MPYMALVSRAARLAQINHALGTHLIDLDALPIDFVEAVLVWSKPKDG